MCQALWRLLGTLAGMVSCPREQRCVERNQINTQTGYLYVSGNGWKETQDYGDTQRRQGLGPRRLSLALQWSRWWRWGPRTCSGDKKHPEVKHTEKSHSDRFPETWERQEETSRDSKWSRGSTVSVITGGKAAFNIPICWMRKLRLRSFECKFKYLFEVMSWLNWVDRGARCRVGQVGCIVGYIASPSASTHHPQCLMTLSNVPWGAKLSLVENHWSRGRSSQMEHNCPVTLESSDFPSSQEALWEI